MKDAVSALGRCDDISRGRCGRNLARLCALWKGALVDLDDRMKSVAGEADCICGFRGLNQARHHAIFCGKGDRAHLDAGDVADPDESSLCRIDPIQNRTIGCVVEQVQLQRRSSVGWGVTGSELRKIDPDRARSNTRAVGSRSLVGCRRCRPDDFDEQARRLLRRRRRTPGKRNRGEEQSHEAPARRLTHLTSFVEGRENITDCLTTR